MKHDDWIGKVVKRKSGIWSKNNSNNYLYLQSIVFEVIYRDYGGVKIPRFKTFFYSRIRKEWVWKKRSVLQVMKHMKSVSDIDMIMFKLEHEL